MPSLVTDENTAIRQRAEPVRYNSVTKLEVIDEKSPRQPPPELNTQISNASFGDTTVNSTSNSDGSDNGHEQSSPTSMTTLPNGALDGIQEKGAREDIKRKELPNGSSVTSLPDRTANQVPKTNGSRNSESSDCTPRDAQPKTSLSSNGGGSVQQSPVEMYIRSVSKEDIATVDNASPSQNRSSPLAAAASASYQPATSMLSVSTTAQSSEAGQAQQNVPPQRTSHSPHRFSSPPAYHAAGSTAAAGPSSGPSSGLAPPAALKHRHTLEVPKLTPARASRDGIDSAFTSGRFSPTTATTPGGRRASLSLVRRNTRSIHSDMPRDEVVPDEDALRWAEAYRQKRASKRKRREEIDDDRVLVGTKVDESHANWVTAYNMLTGIRVSVSRTNAKLDRPLTDADFESKQKSTFDIAGNELVPSAKYDFKFKDYAPWVFRHLRALFRLDPADYLMSLTGKYILSELGSPGKSGSFFYFSRDYRYIIKTIHHAEHKFLRKILKEYYEHVKENPNTLLSQFYGLHRVKVPYGKKIHFVVMNNLFPPHLDIHQTFDLKGSTIGRNYKEEDLEKNPRATMKDLNWLRRHQHLELGLKKKQLFLNQLHQDVALLQRLGIMDYSLLVGIHDQERGNQGEIRSRTLKVFNPGGSGSETEMSQSVLMRTPSKLENARKARELRQMIKAGRPMPMDPAGGNQMPDELDEGRNRPGFVFYEDDGGFRATHENNTPADEIYYLGVIDCLTHYGMIKKLENFWKSLSNDRTQISAVPPVQYGDRFLNFISATTMSPEEVAREKQEREAAEAATAVSVPTSSSPEEQKRVASWGSGRWRAAAGNSSSAAESSQQPAMPTGAQSPPLPSGRKSPEEEETIQRAESVAQRMDKHGKSEQDVPERILKTTSMPASVAMPPLAAAVKQQSASTATADRRESTLGNQGPILPIVEEVGEASSVGSSERREVSNGLEAADGKLKINGSNRSSQSGSEDDSDDRPLTPAKDGAEVSAGFGNPVMSSSTSPRGKPPPTPPKTGYGSPKSNTRASHLKADSADSGYGATGGGVGSVSGSQRSQNSTLGSGRAGKVRSQISRESLDKALPALPKITQRIDEDGDHVTRIGIS